MAFAVLIAGVVASLILRQHPQRDAAAGQSWAEYHRNATGNGWSMLYVQNVYQHADRGSKAMVSIYGDTVGVNRDAWFWREHVKRGSVVAVSPSRRG